MLQEGDRKTTLLFALVLLLGSPVLLALIWFLALAGQAVLNGDLDTASAYGSLIVGLATILLVLVTAYYAYQTRRTSKLMSNQFQRESLRYHSQVLRRVVREWLENLPRVTWTDVEPPSTFTTVGHPAIDEEVDDWQGWFWVAPLSLEDDPFFEDLLEKHANELKEMKEEIIGKFDRFWTLRARFLEEYSDPEPLDDLPFTVETSDWYEFWIFERALLLEREKESADEIYGNIVQANENLDWAQRPPTKVYVGGHERRDILRCDVLEGDEPADAEVIGKADEQVYAALRQVINRLGSQETYRDAKEAARILDDLDELVGRLETVLEEYSGMEIYEGECDYIFSMT